jgi:hypothetical protein
LAQLRGRCALVNGGRDILGCTTHLIDPIGQLGGLLGREDHGVIGDSGSFDQGALLVGPLTAGLPTVLPTSA